MIALGDLVRTLNTFKTECLERFSDDIDPLQPVDRQYRLGAVEEEYLSHDLEQVPSNYAILHFVSLVKTPRLLKTVLRRTIHAWEVLHGEIDFDDLLVANAIRFATPEAYNYILENYREIRSLETHATGSQSEAEKRDKMREHLQTRWNSIVDGVSWDITAAEKLLAFLFPVWDDDSFDAAFSVLQGVRHSRPTDYWLRLNVEELGEDDVRDQDVLRALVNWKKNPDDKHFRGLPLPQALYDHAELAPKFKQFARLALSGKHFRTLASSLFSIMLDEQGVKANADGCAGFDSLWNLAIRDPIDEKEHNNWVLKEILAVLSKSLRFANDLYYYWKTNSETDIRSGRARPELREPIIEEAKSLFQDSPERFIDSLDPDYTYTAYHFAVHYSKLDEGGTGFMAADWNWFANLLLDAARITPSVVVPQITHIFIREDRTIDGFIYAFEKELTLELFGDRLRELMTLIAKRFDDERFSERERRKIQYARSTAEHWLKEKG